jgi:hypothetical protein
MAEDAFEKFGGVEMTWLVETADGEQGLIVSPLHVPPDMSSDEYKDGLDRSLREKFAEMGVCRYACVSECWALAGGLPAEGFIRDHPERREFIMITAEDSSECLSAMREVVRPAHGKPYLTKLEIDREWESVGRFTGMLDKGTRH